MPQTIYYWIIEITLHVFISKFCQRYPKMHLSQLTLTRINTSPRTPHPSLKPNKIRTIRYTEWSCQRIISSKLCKTEQHFPSRTSYTEKKNNFEEEGVPLLLDGNSTLRGRRLVYIGSKVSYVRIGKLYADFLSVPKMRLQHHLLWLPLRIPAWEGQLVVFLVFRTFL